MDRMLETAVFLGLLWLQSPVREKRPTEIQSLVDMARGVAPEYQADVLLRLLERGKIPGAKWKKELLEEVFFTAPQVRHPYSHQNVVDDSNTDSLAMGMAYRFRLDALSIRMRTLRAMLPLDGVRARELFSQIPRL